jgi:hypothetical protein
MTIPKKIHYCWLSGEKIPDDLQRCMQTWQDKMPEYEIVLWDKNKFDVNSVDFVREACAVEKWAFAADYIRAYALYTEGGIYLDTDVVVHKSFTELLGHGFFTLMEIAPLSSVRKSTRKLLNLDGSLKDNFIMRVPGIALNAAILGGEKGHPYLKDVLHWYETRHFTDDEYNVKLVAPDIYAHLAINYGFCFADKTQHLKNDIVILSSAAGEKYAWHLVRGGWHKPNLFTALRDNRLVRKLRGLSPKQSLTEILDDLGV